MSNRVLTAALTVIAVATVIGLVVLWPGTVEQPPAGIPGQVENTLHGEITHIEVLDSTDTTQFLFPGSSEVEVAIRISNGETLTMQTVDEANLYREGLDVVVLETILPGGGDPQYALIDVQRGIPLLWLIAALVIAVVILSRWQGLRSLIGLGISAVIIIRWLAPGLLSGRPPVWSALVASTAIMLVTMVLSHGWSTTTRAALVGTAFSLFATVALAVTAVSAASLTGLVNDNAQYIRTVSSDVDLRGLLLAGIIIGTLGVLDDVTVSQASTVAALRRATPAATANHIFAEALRVGRDHIAATVNTLFLAYAGASLPLLLLFDLGDAAFIETVTSELVAQEIVRTAAGSLGLILAVPVTTAVAAWTLDSAAPELHTHGDHGPDSAAHDEAIHEKPADSDVTSRTLGSNRRHSVTATGNEATTTVAADHPSQRSRKQTTDPSASDETVKPDSDDWESSLRERYGLD